VVEIRRGFAFRRVSSGLVVGARFELTKFHTPSGQRGNRHALAIAPGHLHPAVGHRARDRVDQRLHDRLGDRRHRPLRFTGQAVRLHRPVPPRQAVGVQRRPRPALQARAQVRALGAVRGRAERLQAPLLRDAERYQQTKRRLGRQRGPKVAQIDLSRRLSEASGTCSPATSPSLRQAPLSSSRPDGSLWKCAAGRAAPIQPKSPRTDEAIET
jgi:hypothetical protein